MIGLSLVAHPLQHHFSFKNKFENLADEEVARLQEFAISEGFMGTLEMWDIDYWRNQHKKHLYK